MVSGDEAWISKTIPLLLILEHTLHSLTDRHWRHSMKRKKITCCPSASSILCLLPPAGGRGESLGAGSKEVEEMGHTYMKTLHPFKPQEFYYTLVSLVRILCPQWQLRLGILCWRQFKGNGLNFVEMPVQGPQDLGHEGETPFWISDTRENKQISCYHPRLSKKCDT